MRLLLITLLSAALCLCCTTLSAEAGDNLNFRYWQFFSSNSVELEEVINMPVAKWQEIPSGSTDINFLESRYWQAPTGLAAWIKIELPEQIPTQRIWLELIPNVGLDGQLALLNHQDWVWNSPAGRQSSENKSPTTLLTFAIDHPAKHKTAYLKLNSSQILHFKLDIKTDNEYLTELYTSNLFNGFIFGLLTLAFIYNLAIGFSAAERIYIYYAAYVFFLSMYLLAMTGYLRFAFPEWGGNGSFSNLAILLVIFSATIFIRELLSTRDNIPKFDLVLKAQQIALFCSIFLIGFASDLLAYSLAETSGLIAPFTILIATVLSIKKQNPLAKYVLLAWMVYIISGCVWGWMWLGLVEPSLTTLRVFMIGSVVEVILLSIILGSRFSHLKKSNDYLIKAKKQIEHLSDIDHLTGLLNRQSFFKELTEKLIDAGTERLWLAIKADDFEDLNKQHGHLIGDQIFSKFGRILQIKVKQDDSASSLFDKENSVAYRCGIASRIGENEFAVLLSNCTMLQAKFYAERLMKDFEGIKIKKEDRSSVNASISIGITSIKPGEKIHDAWLNASNIQKTARSKGKNQLATSP
jgi:diguanylate cyclase (GGDEF)-like protein